MTPVSPKRRKPSSFYLFNSRQASWCYIALSLVCLSFAIRDIFFGTGLVFQGWVRNYAYAMQGLSVVVLTLWLAKARVRIERAFLSLWLAAWALNLFQRTYPSGSLVYVHIFQAALWIAAVVLAVEITLRTDWPPSSTTQTPTR